MEGSNMIAANARKTADSYLKLVRRCPLRAIRSDTEYDAAIRIMIPLAGRDSRLDKGELEYLRALAVLVGEYERERYPLKAKTLGPVELLRFLMRESMATINDIGRIIGSQSAASMILNEKREISKDQAKKLAAYFGLDVGAFIT
jgi:HTH-type transcriptional regulator / antitoxin HigA